MIERKIASKAASAIFFEEYNDIDIYIEDSAMGYRKIFKELVNKALGAKFRIEQVFPLGNRNEVIAECEKNQLPSKRKKVYVVDGDFYLFNGDDRYDLKGLFILPRYCIENYLLDEEAIVNIAYEEDSELEKTEIAAKLEYGLWIKENEKLLIDLFIIYAISFKQMPTEQTVGYKINKLSSSNTGIVCANKIKTRIEELILKLEKLIGKKALELEMKLIREKLNHDDKMLIRYVSAKDYLLPLMITRLQSFLKFSCSNTSFKIRLAILADAGELKGIEECLI